METQSERLSKSLYGIAGEYFVAAELSRHGLIAAITLRNTRGVDILVSRPGGKKSATVQVKTLQDGRGEWVLSRADEVPKGDNHYYVFVTLKGPDGNPEYFVVNGNIVAESIRQTHQVWLSGERRDGGERRDNSVRIFTPDEESRSKWNRISVD